MGAGGNSGASGAGGGSVGELRDAACAGWASEPELLPAVLMLVVDVSGSMESQAPGGGGSKWAITRDALSEAMNALPASTAVGIIYYPESREQPSAEHHSATGDRVREHERDDPCRCARPSGLGASQRDRTIAAERRYRRRHAHA